MIPPQRHDRCRIAGQPRLVRLTPPARRRQRGKRGCATHLRSNAPQAGRISAYTSLESVSIWGFAGGTAMRAIRAMIAVAAAAFVALSTPAAPTRAQQNQPVSGTFSAKDLVATGSQFFG